MQERRRTEETIRIEYSKAPDYRVVPANGAWGGLTPRGEVKIDFMLDSLQMPGAVVHSVTPEGKLGPELEKGARVVSRELQVGVLLSVAQAESVAKWLLEKVEEARRLVKEEERSGG